MYQLYRDRPILLLCMIIANIVLSIWCLSIDPVINNDGVTYLGIAELMLDGQWSEAFNYYSWPYYSAFIAATAKVTFLEIETAAHFLNITLVCSLTLAFVCIVGELSNNNQRIMLIAALVILFFPSITKYRSFIIRDFGYLSCYLWCLYFVFRFCSTLNKHHLIGWILFAILSCLFRIEGIAFLLIASYFLVLFTSQKMPHRKLVLSSLSIGLVVLSALLLLLYVKDKYAPMIQVAQAAGKDINNIFELFLANTQNQLGNKEITMFNFGMVIVNNIGTVFYELVRRMAVFYFLFAIYAYYYNIGFKSSLIKRVWLVYVISNLCILIVFSLYNNFLASRYTMASALTLLLLAPFVIDQLLNAFKDYRISKKCISVFALTLLCLTSIEGLNVWTKKNHIKEAGLWVQNSLDADATIYSNDPLIPYYAGRSAKTTMDDNYSSLKLGHYIETSHLESFDYVALSTKPKDIFENLVNQQFLKNYGSPINVINGRENRNVFVYKISETRL